MTDLMGRLGNAQTGANTSVLAARKNDVNQSLSITFDSASNFKRDLGHSVSFAAGDDLCWAATFSADAQTLMEFAFLLTATTLGESAIFGGSSTTASLAYCPFGFYGSNATEIARSAVVPCAGVIDNIYVRESVAPGNGNTWTYTLMLNGVATALTFTLTGTGQIANSSGNPVTVAQGDLISLKRDPTGGTPASSLCRFGARFVPTVAGESMLFSVWTTMPAANADRFGFARGFNGDNATESEKLALVPYPCKIKKQELKVTTGPGGTTRRRDIWLRKGLIGGSQADTALTCGIVDTATAANDNTHEVDISQSDVDTGCFLDIRTNSSASATSPAQMRAAHVAYISPRRARVTVDA